MHVVVTTRVSDVEMTGKIPLETCAEIIVIVVVRLVVCVAVWRIRSVGTFGDETQSTVKRKFGK